ncbi:MAG: flagellar motor switch protein FliG, partial [Rectinemataceae bacterium]
MAKQAAAKGGGGGGGGPAAAQPGKKEKPKSVKDMNGRQKAAIFLVTLGSEISAEIFKHLREDEIETLTFE